MSDSTSNATYTPSLWDILFPPLAAYDAVNGLNAASAEYYREQAIAQAQADAQRQGKSPDDVAAAMAKAQQDFDSRLNELTAEGFGNPSLNPVPSSFPALSLSLPSVPSTSTLAIGGIFAIVILGLIAFIVFEVVK